MRFYTKAILLFILCIFISVGSLQAQTDSTEVTDYEKLFKDKKVETAKGLLTLHKIDEKVYFEFPLKLLGKKMLLGSIVISTSNRSDAAVGEQGNQPLCIYFTQADSTIYMRKANFGLITEDASLKNALKINTIGPIVASFDIEAVPPDSMAVVFEVTDFFVDGNEAIDPFGPSSGIQSMFGETSYSFKKSRSMLKEIMAYEDNITVTSLLSFGANSSFLGFKVEEDRPATFLVKRSLVLLPKETMQPRKGDPRIGVKTTRFMKASGDGNGIQPVYYANRWELVPADKEAFKQGKLVEPVKPIILYVDNQFPSAWLPYVLKGIDDWNKAFKKIGFKNAIKIRKFSEGGSDFDPNNISYNTVNYVVSQKKTAQGLAWVDPRSGQILSASVYLYQGMVEDLSQKLFIQMGAALEKVRSTDIPMEIMGKIIRDVTAHQVGHILGLKNNLGASSTFPVDSLRSPAFTRQYGITPSIMDPVHFNFVAQPGDITRGVRWTPPNLGVYDYYAIRWLYSPLYEAGSREEKNAMLQRWISDKIKNPWFRFHDLNDNPAIDPHAISGDLGKNQIKATTYALDNLKVVLKNMDDWVKEEDEDYRFRTKTQFAVINIQFFWYLKHVLNNIGGIYQYEKYQGDPFPAYKVVPEAVQRKSVIFLLDQLKHLAWLSTARNSNDIHDDAAVFMRHALFPYLLNWGIRYLAYSERPSTKDTYTRAEFLWDIFDHVWAPVTTDERSTKAELSMQSMLVLWLLNHAPAAETDGDHDADSGGLRAHRLALASLGASAERVQQLYNLFSNTNGLKLETSSQSRGNVMMMDKGLSQPAVDREATDIRYVIYEMLQQSKELMQQAMQTQHKARRMKYQYLLLKINKLREHSEG